MPVLIVNDSIEEDLYLYTLFVQSAVGGWRMVLVKFDEIFFGRGLENPIEVAAIPTEIV